MHGEVSKDGKGKSMKRYLIAGSAAAGIALFACTGLAPGARADTIYNYAFSAGAGYSGNGDTASLSGTFSWDATTNSIVSSDIDLTGTDATGTTKGPVSCTDCTTSIYDTSGALYFAINNGPQALYTIYANSLDLNAVDPLALSAYGGANMAEYQGGVPFTSVTGSVDPVGVPGPTPGAGLPGLILAAVGFLAWRRKRKAAALAA
jgi:hypothetical protein